MTRCVRCRREYDGPGSCPICGGTGRSEYDAELAIRATVPESGGGGE